MERIEMPLPYYGYGGGYLVPDGIHDIAVMMSESEKYRGFSIGPATSSDPGAWVDVWLAVKAELEENKR